MKKFKRDFEVWRSKIDKNIELFVEKTRDEEEKLGAIGSIDYLIKEKEINEDLFVIAGDNIFGFDFNDFIKAYKDNPLIALYDIKDKNKIMEKYGVAIIKKTKLWDFRKTKEPKINLSKCRMLHLSKECFVSFFQIFREIREEKRCSGIF